MFHYAKYTAWISTFSHSSKRTFCFGTTSNNYNDDDFHSLDAQAGVDNFLTQQGG